MSTKTEEELSQAIVKHGLEIISKICVNPIDIEKYVTRIFEERLNYPIPKTEIDPSQWMIPDSYKNMDIEKFLIDVCPIENHKRLIKELELYHKNNMIPVLKAMKYIVDTLRKNNIVWGVGRGSSVSSYILYLIGVHKIDSVKYDLPIEEFFKGEQNG